MNHQEAHEECRRRWATVGPWVSEREAEVEEPDGFGGMRKRQTFHRVIGICRDDGAGKVARLEIGEGETWEAALDQAERWWAKQVVRKARRASSQERAEKAGGLPMAGTLFE